jgi:dynein heavy chain
MQLEPTQGLIFQVMLQRGGLLALYHLFSSPCELRCVLCLQEYAYTMAAAYRSEQRRLLSFLRMADFIMCDTLQTVLVQSVSEMLAALEPSAYTTALAEQGQQALDAGRSASGSGAISAFSSSSGGRSLQAMYTMVNSSRRQRASLAVAGMQQKPVTATQQSAAAEAAVAAAAAVGSTEQRNAGQRQPLFELDVVMSSSCDELSFVPEPEQFQVQRLPGTSCMRPVGQAVA